MAMSMTSPPGSSSRCLKQQELATRKHKPAQPKTDVRARDGFSEFSRCSQLHIVTACEDWTRNCKGRNRMREYALYTPATLLRSGSRSIYYVFCGELESEAREELRLCQIGVQRGIPYAKIPIGPMRQPKF